MKHGKFVLFTFLAGTCLSLFNSCNLNSSEVLALLPPKGVTAQYDSVSGVVTVSWDTLQDSSVAGYLVYRRQNLSDTPVTISSGLFLAPPFKDSTATGGSQPETLFYEVRTQDRNGDLSLFSDPAAVKLPPFSSEHFSLQPSTVALWTFNSHKNGTFTDIGSNGFNLSNANNFALTASSFDSASVFTGSAPLANSYLSHANTGALTIAGTGRITYEARVYLATGQSGAGAGGGWFLGTYDGVNLCLGASGYIDAAGQRVRNGLGYWINEQSSAGVIPRNRWFDLAAAFDQTTGQVYAYIDGKPVQLYSSDSTERFTDAFRVSTGNFFVGNDGRDNAFQFSGKVDEIRVSNSLVLGAGLPLIRGTAP